jgi:hypothetical protein
MSQNKEGRLLNAFAHGALDKIAGAGNKPLAILAREAKRIAQENPHISIEDAIILAANGEKTK